MASVPGNTSAPWDRHFDWCNCELEKNNSLDCGGCGGAGGSRGDHGSSSPEIQPRISRLFADESGKFGVQLNWRAAPGARFQGEPIQLDHGYLWDCGAWDGRSGTASAAHSQPSECRHQCGLGLRAQMAFPKYRAGPSRGTSGGEQGG